MPEEKFPKSPQDIDLESAGQKLLASLPNLNKVSKERRFVLLYTSGHLFWFAVFWYPSHPCDFFLSIAYSLSCIVENVAFKNTNKKIGHQKKIPCTVIFSNIKVLSW